MSFLGFPCFVAILKRTLAKECIGLGMRLCRAYQLKRLPEGMQNKRGVDTCGLEGIRWNFSKGSTIGTMLRAHSRCPYLRGIACTNTYVPVVRPDFVV